MGVVNPEWVEAGARAYDSLIPYRPVTAHDIAAAVVDAVSPMIRADEREQMFPGVNSPSTSTNVSVCVGATWCTSHQSNWGRGRYCDAQLRALGLAHAEAVAARLVEVICEQDALLERREQQIVEWMRRHGDAIEAAADLRAQIAADIEALDPTDWQAWSQTPWRWGEGFTSCAEHAARIARGES